MKCPNCEHELNETDDERICEACGYTEKLSVDEDTLDSMVQRASLPNLSMLYRAGKKRGFLKPTQEYGNTA